MKVNDILHEAMTLDPLPEEDLRKDLIALQKYFDFTALANPSHGKIDPFATNLWSYEVAPRLLRWFRDNPSETFE